MYNKHSRQTNLYQRLGVHIKVSDIYASLAFYRTVGMKEIFAYGNKKFRNIIQRGVPTVKENYNGVCFEIEPGY